MSEIIKAEETAIAEIAPVAALNVWSDKGAFDQMSRVAAMLSRSSIVPQNFQGKPEDCFIAVELANRMNTSPIFIMQNLYVVKGKPSWAGQACMAMIASCGKFRSVKHNYTGERGTDNRGCYISAVRIADGETVLGTEVTLAMAKAEGWMSNSKWKNMPEQMLGYRAASFFARMYCPEAMMGLQTTEEIYDVYGAPEEPAAPVAVCEECGNGIAGTKRISASQIVAGSMAKYGKALCVDCQKKHVASAADGNTGVFKCQKCGNELQPYGNLSANGLAGYTQKHYGAVLCAECAQKAKEATEKQEEKKED